VSSDSIADVHGAAPPLRSPRRVMEGAHRRGA
jgi:hypothetical protein